MSMIRGFVAYLLALVLTVTGFSLAQARGGDPVTTAYVDGIEMVICTGIGMTTVTIGPDGEPIETQHVCPDGAQNFVAQFHLPLLERPEARMVALAPVIPAPSVLVRPETAPSARGPPAYI